MKFIVKQKEITKAVADFVHKRLGLKDVAPMTVTFEVKSKGFGEQEILATVVLNSDEFENS